MNHAALMWGSLTVFGGLAAGRAVLAARAAPGVPPGELGSAVGGFLVLGASLVALRDRERSAPAPPWAAYLAAGGTLLYAASFVV